MRRLKIALLLVVYLLFVSTVIALESKRLIDTSRSTVPISGDPSCNICQQELRFERELTIYKLNDSDNENESYTSLVTLNIDNDQLLNFYNVTIKERIPLNVTDDINKLVYTHQPYSFEDYNRTVVWRLANITANTKKMIGYRVEKRLPLEVLDEYTNPILKTGYVEIEQPKNKFGYKAVIAVAFLFVLFYLQYLTFIKPKLLKKLKKEGGGKQW